MGIAGIAALAWVTTALSTDTRASPPLAGQALANTDHALVQVLLGGADGAMPVDIPGQLLADVSVRGGFGAVSQHAGFVQRVYPHLPVLAAHHRHGVVDLLLRGRFEMEILHLLLVGIHAFLRGGAADGFERGVVHDAGDRVLPARRGQAVNHQVDLPQIGLDVAMACA